MRRAWALIVVALSVAGCLYSERVPERPPTPTTSGTPAPVGPPLTFGGLVVDALSGQGVPHATAHVNLALVRPCRQESLGYAAWDAEADADGRFGPLTVPRPNSDDFAFFLHVEADGYTTNVTFVGPDEARGDLGNMTVVLHPRANVTGLAPPGTLVALDAPGAPRLAVADARGRFAFEGARVVPAQWVASTDPPASGVVAAPAELAINAPANGTSWTLQGNVRLPNGAASGADLVAWNGTQMVGVARAGDSGAFALLLPGVGAHLRIEARTADGRYAGALAYDLQGPPAQRVAVLLKALC